GDDGVADADLPVAEDVSVEPAPVREPFDDSGLRHRLQGGARLAELGALSFDAADTEPLVDQLVDVDSARALVAPRFTRLDRDSVLPLQRLDRLGGDQRQRRS